jgi:hypothetical protein
MGPLNDPDGRILETDCMRTVRASQSRIMTSETEVVMTADGTSMRDESICDSARLDIARG